MRAWIMCLLSIIDGRLHCSLNPRAFGGAIDCSDLTSLVTAVRLALCCHTNAVLPRPSHMTVSL